MRQRIAITGSSGFIGTNLVEHYLGLECDVLAMDKKAPRIAEHLRVFKSTDIMDGELVLDHVRSFAPDIIIHLAARTDLEERPGTEGYEANIAGVQNIIRAANSCPGLKLVVFASTRLVFAIDHSPAHDWDYRPSTTYGRSKVVGEQIVRDAASGPRVPWVIVRPTSIWGPWFDIPYRTFFDAVQKRFYFHPRNRLIWKSFGYVGNAVHQIATLAQLAPARVHGKALFLSDFPPIEVGDWSRRISKEMGVRPIRQIPYPMLKSMALMGDLAKYLGVPNPPLTSFRLSNLMTDMRYDLEPTRILTGELPFSLDAGIERTVAWMKSHPRGQG